MNPIKPPTALEKITGNVFTQAGLSLVCGPLIALLPVLAQSLASERQKERVEAALWEIDSELKAQSVSVRNLSDSQYKIINETILTILHTTDTNKLAYLRQVVRNGLRMPEIESQEAALLSRVVRDISAEEIDFLIRNFSYERIQLGGIAESYLVKTLALKGDGKDELIVSGLMSLGLLIPAGPTQDDLGILKFSNGVAKLLALVIET